MTTADRERKAELRERLGWFVKPFQALARREKALLASPTTEAMRFATALARALDARVAQVGINVLTEDLVGTWASDEEWQEFENDLRVKLRSDWEKLSRKRVSAAFVGLIERAHSAVPCSPVGVLPDPVKWGETGLLCRGLLDEALRARGEVRVRKLARVAAEVAESIHHPYLARLWMLDHYARAVPPPAPPKFGRLVDDVRSRLPSQVADMLVEQRSAHVRNAVDHARTRYIPATRVMELEDESGWRESLSSDDLRKMIAKLLELGDVLWTAVSTFVAQAVWLPVMPSYREVIAAVRAKDCSRIDEANARFQECRRKLLAEYWGFCSTTSQPPTPPTPTP